MKKFWREEDEEKEAEELKDIYSFKLATLQWKEST